MTLLHVENLTVRFGDTPVVDRVSFEVARGEVLSLVGESGSGKTTVALSIPGLLPSHALVEGTITFDGQPLRDTSAAQLRSLRGGRIGMVFQEPATALNPLHPVDRQVAECLSLHQTLSAAQRRERVRELLHDVGLESVFQRGTVYPHQLSGGQKQRVLIAMAIANAPDLLIADEPTTALDVQVANQILDLLMRLRKERGMALMLITHDLPLVRRIADRVAVMQHGAIVETQAVSTLFAAPRHAYTQRLLHAAPKGTAAPIAADAPIMLEATDIRVSVPLPRPTLFGPRPVQTLLKGVSLSVRDGETLGIVGESGSGKTTLAHALLRLRRHEGVVRFEGKALSAVSRETLRHVRQRMQPVFQDPFGSLNPRHTVERIVSEGLRVHFPTLGRDAVMTRVRETLASVDLDARFLERYPHELSGGQRQRVGIARALILEPRLMILDEPTSALDVSIQSQVLDLLRAVQERRGIAYLLITHDMRVIRAMAHRVMVLREGTVIEQGSTDVLLSRPQHPYTRALVEAAFPESVIP